MPKFEVKAFGGMRPGRFPELLAPGEAVYARNCRVNDGTIEPTNALSATVHTLASGSQVKTIYRFGQNSLSETQYWFEHTADADFVKGPVADDTDERTYFTGVLAYPAKTNAALATGTAPLPTNYYRMGVVRPGGTSGSPEIQSTFTPGTSITGTGTGDNFTFIYTTTYVTSWGEESPPSLPSGEVTVQSGNTVAVTLPSAPTGNYDVDTVRVYRSNTGTNATEFQLIAEVAVGTASYNDVIADTVLQETLGSSTYTEPDDAMVGLTVLPNGGMMGFFGNQLCFCEPNYPHAWPIRYRRSMKAPIVALAAFESSVIVFTTKGTYLLSGTEPANMVEATEAIQQVCVSKRSVQSMTVNGIPGVVFASNEGLFHLSPSGVNSLTDTIMASEDWAAYAPASMLGLVKNDEYIAFYDNGTTQAGLVLKLGSKSASLTETDAYAHAGFYEPSRGVLYLATTGNTIKKWQGGSVATALWRSGTARLPYWAAMAAGRVEASAYPVTLRYYSDGTLRHTQSVLNNNVFRLPGGIKARTFRFEVEGTSRVSYAAIATRADELGE